MKIATEKLSNGLIIEFYDKSNRYFGDYHRICIEVLCTIPLLPEYFSDAEDPGEELRRAREEFGEGVTSTRKIEKMGVSGEDVERTRRDMIENFMCSSNPYLSRSDFPCRFIRREWARRRNILPVFGSR